MARLHQNVFLTPHYKKCFPLVLQNKLLKHATINLPSPKTPLKVINSLRKSLLTCSGIKDVNVNRRRDGVGRAASIIAVVTFIGVLEQQHARGAIRDHLDPWVVVNHPFLVEPKDVGRTLGGLAQGANQS